MNAGKKRTGTVIGAIAIIVTIGAAVSFYTSRRDSRNEAAQSAFFLALKEHEAELKTVAQNLSPAAAAPVAATGKEKKAPAQAAQPKEATPEEALYKPLDVDAKFPKTVARYQELIQKHSGTRAAFEALLALGSMYLEHGQATKASPWFEKAVADAPNPYEKSLAGLSFGRSLESEGKYADAVAAYEKALGQAEASMKGALLLAIARNHELLKDGAKARATYDRILAQLPNTEAAKDAEAAKAHLE